MQTVITAIVIICSLVVLVGIFKNLDLTNIYNSHSDRSQAEKDYFYRILVGIISALLFLTAIVMVIYCIWNF